MAAAPLLLLLPSLPTLFNDGDMLAAYLQHLSLLLGLFLALCLSCLCLCMLENDGDGDVDEDDAGGDIEQGFPRYPPEDETAPQQQEPFEDVLWSAADLVESCQDKDKEDQETNINSSLCCSICWEKFKEGEGCKIRQKCKHVYHKTCINLWLDRSRRCPLCRGYVLIE